MKVFILLLALILSFLSPAYGRDTHSYQSPTIVAAVTDEPCKEKVMAVVKARGLGELAPDLVHVRVSKFHDEANLEACVLPKDEDGDFPIIDEKGRTGYLISDHLKELL